MEYVSGFIAGVGVGVAIIGIIAVNRVVELKETILKLEVDLKYSRKEHL